MPRASTNGGTGTPAAARGGVAVGFRWQMVTGPDGQPGNGNRPRRAAGERHPAELERRHREVLVPGVAVDPFAEIEDQLVALHPSEPRHVRQVDRDQRGLVALCPEM